MTGGDPRKLDPAIDVAFLNRLVDDIGAKESARILGLFKLNLREYCKRMQAEVAAKDIRKIKKIAHGLKGLCMQFGATHSVEIAKMIELKVESAEEAKVALDRLLVEIARVEAFVDSWSEKAGG